MIGPTIGILIPCATLATFFITLPMPLRLLEVPLPKTLVKKVPPFFKAPPAVANPFLAILRPFPIGLVRDLIALNADLPPLFNSLPS